MPKVLSPIYSVGNLGFTQAALRDDGQWFTRVGRGRNHGWGKWVPATGRPLYAWYDPRQGKAKLPPKDNEK